MEETTPPSTSSQNNRRIAKNTLMLYFRMILTMIVSLYTSRVILNTLGVEDFGIYNVVGGIATMLSFFNGAMSSATQRFLSYDIGLGDMSKLRNTFNASLIIHICIALFIFILGETIGLWFVKSYLVIPTERMDAAIWVYHFAILSFMITIIQVPYNATIIAHERMNIYAYLSILEVTLKLLIVFMLTWISYDKLKLYGLLHFLVVFSIYAIYNIYTSRKFEETKFEIVKDWTLFKTMISFSGWSLFSNIAFVAKGQMVGIILNMFFGPVVNAAQAVANQVQGGLNNFSSNFQVAVNPQIIKSYASNESNYLITLIVSSAKFSYFLLLFLSLPIIVEIDQVLKLWLKTVPEFSNSFTILLLITVLLDSMSRSLRTAIQATGRIKLYESVIGTISILTLSISYLFLKMGFHPNIVFIINILISIIDLFLRLYNAQRLIDFPISIFVNKVIIKNIIITLFCFSLPLVLKNVMDESLSRLIIITIVSLFWNTLIILIIGLNNSEKTSLYKELNKIFKRIV